MARNQRKQTTLKAFKSKQGKEYKRNKHFALLTYTLYITALHSVSVPLRFPLRFILANTSHLFNSTHKPHKRKYRELKEEENVAAPYISRVCGLKRLPQIVPVMYREL